MGPLFAGIAPESIPPGLLTATVRASLSFAEQPATAIGLSSGAAVALARGVISAMMISKLKVLGAVVLVCALTLGGLQAVGVHVNGIPRRERLRRPHRADPANKLALGRA